MSRSRYTLLINWFIHWFKKSEIISECMKNVRFRRLLLYSSSCLLCCNSIITPGWDDGISYWVTIGGPRWCTRLWWWFSWCVFVSPSSIGSDVDSSELFRGCSRLVIPWGKNIWEPSVDWSGCRSPADTTSTKDVDEVV